MFFCSQPPAGSHGASCFGASPRCVKGQTAFCVLTLTVATSLPHKTIITFSLQLVILF